jgi:SAM-dependent methyltransferase
MPTAKQLCDQQLGTGYKYQQFGPNLEPGEKMQQKLEALDGLLPEVHAGSVLDIGTNLGFFSFLMEKRGASSVLGVEKDKRRLNWCRQFATATNSTVRFVEQFSGDLGRFDLVLCMSVGHYLYGGDFQKLAQGLAALTAPGGLCIYEGPLDRSDYIADRIRLNWTKELVEGSLADAFDGCGYHGPSVHASTRYVYWGRNAP